MFLWSYHQYQLGFCLPSYVLLLKRIHIPEPTPSRYVLAPSPPSLSRTSGATLLFGVLLQDPFSRLSRISPRSRLRPLSILLVGRRFPEGVKPSIYPLTCSTALNLAVLRRHLQLRPTMAISGRMCASAYHTSDILYGNIPVSSADVGSIFHRQRCSPVQVLV